MVLMADDSPFLAAFGLNDNPFNPSEFRGVEARLLDTLSSLPLPLDEAPELSDLFIETAGPFQENIENYQSFLKFNLYRGQPSPGLGKNSLLIRITGKSGTGKTTLANEMVRRLKLCAKNDGDVGLYREEGPYSSTDVTGAQIEPLCAQVRDAARPLSCIILDDIPFASWTVAEKLYNDLRKKFQIARILVLSDVDFLRKPLPPGKLLWRDFQTSNLTARQAVSLVSRRISLFRPDYLRDHFVGAELELFPFDASDIAKSVAPPNGDLDTPGSIPLRLLNWLLDTVLNEMMDEFPPVDDLTKLSSAQLRKRLISLERAYQREIGLVAA
jgi:hypothetical protein